jgi:predicted RNA-binding Zn-ribbon protein involved in translation (DUF1610 family)
MAQNLTTEHFSSYNVCSICGKRLPDSYTKDCCPNCLDAKLLRDAKDYIRENNVNEYQVAEHFDIPVKIVKEWIRAGHIEYCSNGSSTFTLHCQHCGAPVTFGSVCPACLKIMNSSGKGGFRSAVPDSDHQMRFLQNSQS